MKLSKFFKAVGLVTILEMSFSPFVLSMGKAQANGLFGRTCSNPHVYVNTYQGTVSLVTDCKRKNGSTLYNSTINLNKYVVNNHGNLDWESNGEYGNFLASCYNIKITGNQYDNFIVKATCYTGLFNFTKDSSLDLDDRIGNDDGDLVYIRTL